MGLKQDPAAGELIRSAATLEEMMRKLNPLLLLGIVLSSTLSGCGASSSVAPTQTTAPMSPTPTRIPSVPTLQPTPVLTIPTLTPFPKGETIIVTSAEDSGPGTLRQGLLDANPGDTINFDTSVFPPVQPNIIYLQSVLPIDKGNLTIDASNAGVILDGSRIPEIWDVIYIVSNNNTVSGLLVRNFSGSAIHISGGQNNLIMGNVFGGSDYGIGLWGEASNNTIMGNYIGVLADGVTPLRIRIAGITLGEGAHDNQIGPNNTIAFSDQWGIIFGPMDVNTVGNTISQNSIHDNGSRGIALNGSNNSLGAPTIFDFDLQAGTLDGVACAQCTVEIFSDSGDEGAIYEGQAVADEKGMFTYDNGAAFRGPFLTATATDANRNSSEFSPHTFGLIRSLTLQEGNDHLIAPMVTRPYQELADNRISTYHIVDPTSQYFGLLEVEQLGTKWIRLSMDHMEWEGAVRHGWYSKFDINNIQSSAISLLAENGAKIIYVLVHWDEDNHAESPPNYGNEEEVQLFLDYTRLIVSHFKDRIQYYEILNEGLHYVEVEDYINLIHRAIPVIHEADPDAKILVGGATALRLEYSHDYLFDVLQSDVMPLVDMIGFHPMYGESPQYDETRGYYYNYPALVQEIKDVATSHGFRGEYVASEMLWRTPANPYLLEQPSEYTDTVAAKYYARAIVMNLGTDVVAGITGEILEIPINRETVRNLSNVMAGARAMDLPIIVQSEATNIRNYSFSMPNGDKLIALWSDGIAADYDPGIVSTVILPGYASHAVTGIDVLYGFEQELVSSNENNDLVIRDFLLKDYPIFIRLSP